MTDNSETTESFPDPSLWLDTLSDAAALTAMADDQKKAAIAVKAALPDIQAAAGAALKRLRHTATGRLFYAGAGTSIRIGVQDGVELAPSYDWPIARTGFLIAGGEAALQRSIEGAEDDIAAAEKDVKTQAVNSDDVVIGLAASGITPFTCAALKAARTAGAVTIGIANNPDTPLIATAEYGITLATGGELVAGSTRMKAGTAQKICLNMLSTLIMVRMGKVKHGLMVEMRVANEKLRQRQKKIQAVIKDKA